MSQKITDPALLALGNKILALRKAHGLTQEQLADKIGMSVSAVNRIECGQRQPRLATIQKIADCFNVDPNFLYDFKISSSALSQKGRDVQSVPVLARIPVSEKTAQTALPSGYVNVRLLGKWKGFVFAFRMPDDSMFPHIQKGDLLVAATGESPSDGCFVVAMRKDGLPGVYRFCKSMYGFQFSKDVAGSFVLKNLDPGILVATVVLLQRDLSGDQT